MYLDIKKLLRADAEKAEGVAEFNLSTWDFYGYTVPAPVGLSWKAVSLGNAVRLAFTLKARVRAECARCLGEAWEDVYIEKEYNIMAEDLQEEVPELPIDPAGMLDLQELAYSELVIEGPITVLCSEDCRGICQTCGKMRAECGCTQTPEGDPRLQVLKQLLTNEDDGEENGN